MLNSIGTIVYFSLAIGYAFFITNDRESGVLFAGGHLLLLVALVLIARRNNYPEKPMLDSHGFTRSTGKAIMAFLAVAACGWHQVAYAGEGRYPVPRLLFYAITAYVEACALYLSDYLQPLKASATEKVLEAEHREVLAIFSSAVTAMLVVFGAVFGSYLVKDQSSLNSGAMIAPILLAFYTAVGYTVWILRPFQSRAKEIRIQLTQLSDTSQGQGVTDEPTRGDESAIVNLNND